MKGKDSVILACLGSIPENQEKLIKILKYLAGDVLLITFSDPKPANISNKTYIHLLNKNKNLLGRYIYGQILMVHAIYRASKKNNTKLIVFAFGQDLKLAPIISARIIGKKIIIRSDGRPSSVLQKYDSSSVAKSFFFRIIEEIDYRLANVVLTECEYMISENNFQKYGTKVGTLFVDVSRFVNKKPIYLRIYDIGFVGRFSKEKGIQNFLESLKLLDGSYNVILIGDGDEKNNVLRNSQSLKFTYIDWVENSMLSNHLNDIKLLVVPSYREGLPNTVLESMACGTPVLATPVGGIPGIIKDEDTGFIMDNNSPECIAANAIRALEHPDLEGVAQRARALVEREFTFERAMERWQEILWEVGDGRR